MSVCKRIGEGTEISCKFEWKINNFFSYTEPNSEFRSPKFHVSDTIWVIKIYPNGEMDADSAGYVSLYLCKITDSQPAVFDCRCGIKAANHAIVYEKSIVQSFEDGEGWGWSAFIKKSVLQKRHSELVPSDTLTIIFSVEIKNDVPDVHVGHSKLVKDLKSLFMSKENFDVTLNVKDKIYHAHKAILKARSPVLAAMFTNEMEEKRTGIVNIPDCDPEAFNVFLLFLYSGIVNFTICNICELYKISDKYAVTELKIICADYMTRNISVENFCDILILGNQFSDNQLLTEVQCFFNKNFGKIVTSEKWRSFAEENFHLANTLLVAMAPNIKIM